MDCGLQASLSATVSRIVPRLAQTHIHGAYDAIQPSHPLWSPSSPAFNLSQHQGLFKGVSSLHHVAKQKWSPAGKEPEREPRAGSGWWQSPRLRGELASIPGPHSLAPAPLAVSACPGTGRSGSTSLSAGCPWPWESPLSENVPRQLSEWQMPFWPGEAEAGDPRLVFFFSILFLLPGS